MGKTQRLYAFFRSFRLAAGCPVGLYAANACFFTILSVFPGLLLLLELLRYTAVEPERLMLLLRGILPTPFLEPAKRWILSAQRSTSGFSLGFSAVTALWSASRGVRGLMTGLNAVYGAQQTGSALGIRLRSLVYTLLFLLLLVLSLVLRFFSGGVFRQLPLPAGGGVLRPVWKLLLSTALFCLLFRCLPNRPGKLGSDIPGALLAAVGWMIFTKGFGVYVQHFALLTDVYGSVYAVALSMLWLYFCITIVLYAGALNRFLETEKQQKNPS